MSGRSCWGSAVHERVHVSVRVHLHLHERVPSSLQSSNVCVRVYVCVRMCASTCPLPSYLHGPLCAPNVTLANLHMAAAQGKDSQGARNHAWRGEEGQERHLLANY